MAVHGRQGRIVERERLQLVLHVREETVKPIRARPGDIVTVDLNDPRPLMLVRDISKDDPPIEQWIRDGVLSLPCGGPLTPEMVALLRSLPRRAA